MRAQAVKIHIDQKAVVITMGVLIGVLALSYIILVNKTVHNVVERRSLEGQNSQLASRASELEFSYMGQKNGITPDEALSIGFSEAKKVTYVPRATAITVLTLNR